MQQKNLFLTVILMLLITSVFATDYTSTSTGNWSNSASWTPAGVPGVGDNVTIAAGHTITIDQDISITNLTVNGTLVIGNDATGRDIIIAGTTTIAGSFTVGAFDITHTVTFKGAVTNNGTLDFYNSSSQVANLTFDGSGGNYTVGGSNSPQFNSVTFSGGTITAGVALDINGALIIEDATTFADGNYTHTVAGNWTENGTGQRTGNGTIQMDASLIQSITTTATFYNLTYNGSGIGVIANNISVLGDFNIINNTEVQSSSQNTFQGTFTVADGSKYTATAGRATFNLGGNQTITIGTTDGIANVIFYQAYFQNGGTKTINGDMTVNNVFSLDNGTTIDDNGDTHTQTLVGGGYINGTCNFSGTILFKGGTYYDTVDDDFTLGTANISVRGYTYIGGGDIMRVNGNLTIDVNDDNNHIGLIVNDNAQLIGTAGKTLDVKYNTSLYIRGASNFPTGFGTITFEEGSYARYDAALADQTISNSVTYWHLYLNQGTSKTAAGNLDVNGNLYIYNSTEFKLGNNDMTIAGDIRNTDDAWGNGSLSATGGTVTFDAPDRNQYIYDAGTGTYTFNNIIFTNTAPTAARGKYIRNDIIVNGNFSATNTGGSKTNRLYVDIDDHIITGGNNFSLATNVWLLTSGTNTFQTSMSSFSGTINLDVNSTIRFDRTTNGSDQNIPGGFIYGNIELYGSNKKIPQGSLDINGNVSAVGYTPVFTDNSNQINVAGDWNMSLTTTNLTGTSYIVFDGTIQDISQSHFSNVYFSGSGTKTISGHLDILKNLVIQTGVTVETEQYINIEGNWEEQGTAQFHQTGGITTFDGTSADQTVTQLTGSYFNYFYIDKPGASKKVTTINDLDINGTFNFVENNAEFDLNGKNLHVARDFYFREGCTFTHNNGKVYFDGNDVAQLIRDYNSAIIVFYNVEFSGTAVKRLYDNSFKFEGDVFINNSTLDGQWWDHYVEGNWTNTGIFRHSRTLHFNGAQDQTISQSSFHSVRFGGGNYTKLLSGDINLTGNLWIDDATLDVSASSHSISLDDYWHNDSTGSFIAHEGTVTVTGEYNRIFTGETNTLYGSGQVITQGGTKNFYNLTINATNEDYWMFIHGNLTVLNNFDIEQARFYQSYDASTYGVNTISVGGNFINKGSIYNNNYGTEKIILNPTSGAHIFNPGSSNTYSIIEFNGVAGTSYDFLSNLNLYSNRTITINNGDLDLNSHKITTHSSGGDITMNAGSLEVDSAATVSIGNGATFTNAGGVLNLIGHANDPASLIATTGNFIFVQTSGTIAAKNYLIEKTSGNGIDIQGGSIDATNTFQEGSFSDGTGTAYITTSGIDLGGDRTIDNVTFNSGPTYNVQRTSGNGAMNFVNAIGTLAGEGYDNDDADPGTHINWTNPGAVYWDGNTDGDGDNVHWNDPLNWSSDAVPDATTTVILDHSAVSGNYTVNLSTTADGLAKSLLINSGANQISLVLNGQNLTVSEDVTIGSNSVLTQTNATDIITLGGSWANEGTFNEGTATVVFNPVTGTQTITTKGAGDAFYNLTINGTGGTNVISSTLDVDGSVSLQGGILSAGTNTITVAGNWTRTGGAVFEVGTSTVNFDGNNQTINGGEFYNFITSNSGTKTATANIDINNDLTIKSGTVFDGGTNIIYVGDDWTNEVGATGFTQSGAGSVIFDGTVSDQDIGSSSTQPTTFNNVTISGTRTKRMRQNMTINGNLIINAAALYITDGLIVDGAGASNEINMSAGRIYVNGANNFPQNFETINLSGGVVDYYADIDQTIYATTYHDLMLRHIWNSGVATTKTLSGDIDVKATLYVYDDETTFDVNNHTIKLVGNLDKHGSTHPIIWGANGTLIHYGEYWSVDPDIVGFNNVIKKNRGYMRVYSHSITISGDMSILEDAYLQQDTVNITSTGTGKTFTLAATAFVYSYNPETMGTQSGRKAFPVNFANYNLNKDSRVYIRGTVGDQEIYTKPVYGNLYIYTDAEINISLDGDLDVDNDFRMYYDEPTLVDNGHNINIAGDYNDIRTYSPSASSTMTFDGADQRIVDAGHGATIFDMNNVVFAGSGQKSLYYGGDDYYIIHGNLTINSGVTVYIPRRLDFKGSSWTNNGTFNHTAYIVNFNGTNNQDIDPGEDNNFYAVDFNNSGKIIQFKTHGINVNNGTFTIENNTTVNMGSAADDLTHYIASERITNNGGTWTTDDANFIFDRNGTQYIPQMTCQDMTFRRYDQWSRVRYLEGQLNIDNLTIEEGTQLRCSTNSDNSTPTHNVIMTGNFTNDGILYAWGNTFDFESNTTDAKTIKQGQGSFDNVKFNQNIWGQSSRTYTLTEETRFYEKMIIGNGATLVLNGQILRLGNDDPNDPVEPQAESHDIQSGGTLYVDANASLIFSCRDLGNPKLDVEGTLKIVGTNGNNANITSSDWYSNSHRINININNGGTIYAQYYLIKYLVDDGFYIDAGATINPTDNFSNGTWSDMNTSGSGTHYYLECNADVSGIGTVDNVTFNFGGTPSVSHHFNVKRAAGSTGVLTFGGTASGLLAGSTYEADDVAENNTGSSLIEWPPVSEVYWVGTVSTDWFNKDNWSPATVPTNAINAVIPTRPNNPIITGSNAVCKNLQITNGFLTLQSGYDLDVNGDVYVGSGSDVGILAIDNSACKITVTGSWTRAQNALFVHGDGTVEFNATGGSISIDPRNSAFGNLTFNGGATFICTRQETFIDDNLTITNGTFAPSVNNYELHIKGNYNNAGGTFDNTTHGTVIFDGTNAQTITNGEFWNVTIDGSNIKTTANLCTIDGNLIIKNGTLKGGDVIDMNNYVTIETTGTFDDGGFSHTFSGVRWTGQGGYLGTGTVNFDRNGYQYINGAKFNNLTLKNNGGVILLDDINMTGNLSLIELNTYLNVQTYQITNTSGIGTFSMEANRRIYVRGANNFPTGFNNYSFDRTSYTFYDGTMQQTIASIPVVYGRLYLDNSTKIASGHLDINGILYFYDDATLDVTANNYRINLESDWYNTSGGTFIPHEGEVIFDGSDAHTYLRVYDDSKNSNPFYKLTINKDAGDVRSYWTDITVQNNLRVLNGQLYQNQTMYVGGDMMALSGTFAATGTYYLNKVSGTSNLQLNGSTLYNLTIDAGATYFLQDALRMNGQFNLIAGTFDGNEKLVRMGDYGEVNEISGLYKVGAGGILELPNYGTLKINSGGEIWVVGDANNVATVTNYNGRYYFNVENGGTIRARNYVFEYMAESGIYIKDGGIIDPAYNFSYGTFANVANGGTCLRIENNQSFTEAGSNPVAEVSFPYNPGGGASNVTKTISSGGTLDFKNYSGDFAGEDFDNDPDDLINWVSPPYVMWTGNIDNDWYKIGNWEVNAGPDRIPLISDNVIITKRTNQPVIDHDGAVAKTLEVQVNAILTLNTSALTDTTLIVAEDVFFDGSIVMTSSNDRIAVGGNWSNSGMFIAGLGTVIFNSKLGVKSINNLYDNFYNLTINTESTVQLSRNTTVNNEFEILNGNFDLASNSRILTVKGNFNNFGNFIPQRGKIILATSNATQVFNPGASSYYNMEISADAGSTVRLTSTDLNLQHNLNINSGTFDLNHLTFNMGDNYGTDVLTINGGTLNINSNAYLKMGNNAAVDVNNSGVFTIVGSNIDNPGYIQSQSGYYSVNINSGAKINAQFYNIMNTNSDGIVVHSGATIDATNNFTNGVWRNGNSGGQYLWLQNDFADFTVKKVYFHGGASVNVKRLSGSGIITFEDALGSVAGENFEDDNPANGATTGLIHWTTTHNKYIWVGSVSTDWQDANNWNVSAPHVVPTSNDIAIIPDIDEATHYNPLISSTGNAVCYDISIEDNGFLTMQDNSSLTVSNSLVVASNGIFTVKTGSLSDIYVADIYIMEGTFNHGNSSTVIFNAPAGKILAISSSSNFYNLTINSSGVAEYSTGTSLNIDGTFYIQQGVFTVSDPADLIYVGKDWVNTATFNHGNGKVILNGQNQSITNTGTGNFYDLYIQGVNTKTLASDITVEHDIKINANSTLNGADKTLTLYGDWTNRGTFAPATSTVKLVGSAPQLINNYNEENFYNFTLNNTANAYPQVILYSNLRLLTGAIWSMLDGIFETSPTEMLIVEDNVSLVGGNTDQSYVSGPITKIGDDDFIFPIGDGTVFARLGINIDNSGSATFVAQYHNAPYSDVANVASPLNHVSGSEHWTLDRTAGSEDPIVTFYWEDGARSGIDKLSSLTTALYVTDKWEDRGQGSTTGTVTQGTITSNVAFTTFGACGFGSLDTDNPLNSYNLWTGAVSTEWNNPNNWTIGVPTLVMNTLISDKPANQPVIDINAKCAQLIINENASVIVNPLKSLIINGKLFLNGSFELLSDNTGNACFINNSTISYGANSHVTTQLYLTAGQYHYLSAPTTGVSSDRFKVDNYPLGNPNLYRYEESGTTWNLLNEDWYEYTGNLVVMNGYAYYGDQNLTINITRAQSGDFNVGDKSKSLIYTGNTEVDAGNPDIIHRGWNFVGNPYPAYLDWNNANWTKTNIYNSIYIWNGTNYSYYVPGGDPDGAQDDGVGTNNGSQFIPPMQGYFVKVKEDAGNLDNNQTGLLITPVTARTTSTQAFWKSAQPKNNIDIIKLTVSGNGYTDETAIRFSSLATNNFDDNYDAFKLFTPTVGVPQIYSVMNNNVICAINGLPEIDDNTTIVHVGFEATSAAEYTITVNDFSFVGNHTAYFVDTYTGKIYDLQDLNYKFSSDAGQFNDRFIIKFNNSITDIKPISQNNDVNVKIFAYRNILHLQSDVADAIVGKVQIYNISGQLIYNEDNNTEFNSAISLGSIANGVYIVKIINKYGIISGKVMLMR